MSNDKEVNELSVSSENNGDCQEDLKDLNLMASTLTRLKYSVMRWKIKHLLLLLVIIVVLLFVVVKILRTPVYGIVREVPVERVEEMNEKEMKAYMKAMFDARERACFHKSVIHSKHENVSILIDFHEKSFYNLKLTLTSVLKNTPDYLYNEIILIDDGTQDRQVRVDAVNFLNSQKFGGKVKAFRSEKAEGPSKARYKASKLANGAILVYLSTEVAVNEGWLEPLLTAVRKNRKVMAVPHFDTLLPGYRFFTMTESLANVFSWTLSIIHYETGIKSYDNHLITPVMRGDAFAVDRNYFEGIGGYDDGLAAGGGQALELSFRAWMCGAEIQKIPCSRVAVHTVLSPQEITNPSNFRRIAELWLDDERKKVVYKQSGVPPDMSEEEQLSLRLRRSFLAKNTRCENFDWYLKNVATMVRIPTAEMEFFGKLSVETGHCIRSVSAASPAITLGLCHSHTYELDAIFELNKRGEITQNSRCLAAGSDKVVRLGGCSLSQDTVHSHQKWSLDIDGKIKNIAHGGETCLAHHSVRKDDQFKHSLVLARCEDGPTQYWSFIKY